MKSETAVPTRRAQPRQRTGGPLPRLAPHPPRRTTGPLRQRPRPHRYHSRLVQRHRHASARARAYRHPL